MKKEEIKAILELHKKWLNDKEDGIRANLSSIDLRYANLRGVNLSEANLREADLSRADLRGVNLSGANLSEANLRYADLRYANLREADLRGANLTSACGIVAHSIDNVGTYNGQVLYIPYLDMVWAGCWSGSHEEFQKKCDEVIQTNDEDLNLDMAKSFVDAAYKKYLKLKEKYEKGDE